MHNFSAVCEFDTELLLMSYHRIIYLPTGNQYDGHSRSMWLLSEKFESKHLTLGSRDYFEPDSSGFDDYEQ